MVAASAPCPAPVTQRRERKKRQTRDALLHTAIALFIDKGYEHTAVREITDAVDVSERTFFRYFSNKEDLVLSSARDMIRELLRELAARPAAEPPFGALCEAFRRAVTTLSAERESLYPAIVRLIDATPPLLAAHLRYLHDSEEEIIAVLAARENVDPATDPRPRCAAAVFNGLLGAVSRDWHATGAGSGPASAPDSAAAMLTAFNACSSQVTDALSGHWH